MAIDLNDTDDGLFPRLGRIGRVLYSLNVSQSDTAATLNDLLGRYQPPDEDLTGQLAVARDATNRSLTGAMMGQLRSLAQSTLIRMVRDDQPTKAGSLRAAIEEVIRQMEAAGDSVSACAVSAVASPFGDNTGDGAVLVEIVRPDGRDQENAVAEVARLECTADGRTGGATSGAEPFRYFGVPNPAQPFDWDWPRGSGGSASFNAADALRDYPAGRNVLVNSGFDAWNGTTNPTGWTVSGTLSKETSLLYGSGAAAVRVASGNTAALVQLFGTDTTFRSAALSAVGFCVRLRGSASLGGGVLTVGLWDGSDWVDDATGADAKHEIDLTGLTTGWEAEVRTVRTPAVLPDNLYFRAAVTTAPSGGDVILDHLAACPLTAAYPGGPGLAVFSGADAFALGDGWEVTAENDRAGADLGETWQTFFDRLFGMRAMGLLLPSSDTPTIPDTMIADPAESVGGFLPYSYFPLPPP